MHHITVWISHKYTFVPSLLEPPFHLSLHPTPLGCHRAPGWIPCVTSNFLLAIYFTCGNVHVSVFPFQFVRTLKKSESVGRVWFFAALWTVACQASLSMEFSSQEK